MGIEIANSKGVETRRGIQTAIIQSILFAFVSNVINSTRRMNMLFRWWTLKCMNRTSISYKLYAM